jgi:uncharacterized protein (DUF1015 family)
MSLIFNFKGFRPSADRVETLSCLPYDVISRSEASEHALENDSSFYRIIRPEIDLPDQKGHSEEVYQQARKNFKTFKKEGYLKEDPRASFYLYRQKMGDHVQCGLFVGASCQEYLDGKIKKHEFTISKKEKDRALLIETQQASADPVFLIYRDCEDISELLKKQSEKKPDFDFVSSDGIEHVLWVIDEAEIIEKLKASFAKLEALYIADGHHRSAASARYFQKMKKEYGDKGLEITGQEPWNYFLAALYPDSALKILDYNRVVKNLNGHSPQSFLESLKEKFDIEKWQKQSPPEKHSWALFLDNNWYLLKAKKETLKNKGLLENLDVAILQDEILSPLLNISDPRHDDNIDFVGGIRGLDELEKRCREDAAAAFAMFPTSLEELMQVADEDKIMPPKSTWFEPKIRSGLLLLSLEE